MEPISWHSLCLGWKLDEQLMSLAHKAYVLGLLIGFYAGLMTFYVLHG